MRRFVTIVGSLLRKVEKSISKRINSYLRELVQIFRGIYCSFSHWFLIPILDGFRRMLK